MTISNTKRIEEAATNAVKTALLKCPVLGSYIENNDKTPSYDGFIFAYRNPSLKNEYWIGSAPVQIKGTEKVITGEFAYYQCKITDLQTYYNGGGCIFFLVSVKPSTGDSIIYYNALSVFDLKRLLSKSEGKKSTKISLKRFSDDSNEIGNVIINFIEDARKQTSFIGRKELSLDQIENKDVEIEAFTVCASGLGINEYNIYNYFTTHDFYLYAKPKGLDIDIPIEKVCNAIVSRPVLSKVLVKNIEYYPSYTVIHEKGRESIRIGKGIQISFGEDNSTVNMSFTPKGTLSEIIQDLSCFIAILENKEVTLNEATLPFNCSDKIDIKKYKDSLRYYADVKRMLEVLGVTEELQCDQISAQDDINIRNFVNAVLYNKGIGFPDAEDNLIFGSFKIANLSIWIWANKREDGYYCLDSFYDNHNIVIFDEKDQERTNPISVSHYLLLNDDAFKHCSNIDIRAIKEDVCSMEHDKARIDIVTLFMLNILKGYDEQEVKDGDLLDLAECVCGWLREFQEGIPDQVQRLNELQIVRRRRSFNTKEIIELSGFTSDANMPNIRCGAFLLLEDNIEAQNCFNLMSHEDQDAFLSYPICRFGKLIKENNTDGKNEI